MRRKNKNQEMMVRVNKFGLSLVVALFVLEFLIALEFNSGIVSAAVSSVSSSSVGFSDSDVNPQYYAPGYYESYSQQYASTYWPALANPDICEATTDFIMGIEPGSCTPGVVRSDLLEEQNVPVFCKVDILKINPLIDISQLKSVKFTGSSNPYVAGISFHPNKEAIYSQKTFLDNPLINDVGYVVVLLKKIPAEKNMPDSIKVNLTGVLSYDVSGLFGAGKNNYYLNVVDDNTWEKGVNYKENSFFKGRGYLRLDWIEDDRAGVSIYRDKDTKISSFNLKVGETSNTVYMPGFYCKAGVNVKLDAIEAGVKRAELDVDGDINWLVKGEKFLDGKCSVVNIQASTGKGVITVDNVVYEVVLDGAWKKVQFKEKDVSGNDIEKVYAWNNTDLLIFSNEKWILADVTSSNNDATWNQKLNSALSGVQLSSKNQVTINCQGIGTRVLSFEEQKEKQAAAVEIAGTAAEKTEEEVSQEVRENFAKAKEYAYSINKLYGDVGEGQESYAAKALYELGELAEKAGLNSEALEVYNKLIQEYPDSYYAIDAGNKLGSIGAPSTGYNEHFIQLIKIETPEKKDASADFVVRKISDGAKTDISAEQVQEKELFGENKFQLVKLYRDKVDLIYYQPEVMQNNNVIESARQVSFPLSYADGEKIYGDYVIALKNINLKEIARVSLVSEKPSDYSSADFSFEVGIEKRAIQLSPEKIKSKIDSLNETIKKWEGIVNKLGDVVSVMKGACLATSAILLVKNFFSNLGGGATARQKVMPVWYARCAREYGNDRKSMDECLSHYSSDIEKDVQATTKAIEETNKKVSEIQNLNKLPGANLVDRDKARNKLLKDPAFVNGFSYDKYKIGDDGKVTPDGTETISAGNLKGASLEDLRDLLYYKELAKGGSADMKANANVNIAKIANRLVQKRGEISQDLYAIDAGADPNSWINSMSAEFHLSGKAKGSVYLVPIPGSYGGNTGFYAVVREEWYQSSGNFDEYSIQNIGKDGSLDILDDPRTIINMNYDKGENINILGLNDAQSTLLNKAAVQAIRSANTQYGRTSLTIDGKQVRVNKAPANEKRCTDFMSPQDCKILFNVCDPVLCPSSRCDLGGTYRVDNVIQSGIIGSIALCLPNFPEVIIPVCISGIYAGLDTYVQILKSYRDCLQEQLDSGKVVGICDEIQSIYLCEFFWRQIGPYLDLLMLKAIETSYGQGTKGGGEYLTVQDAWDNLQSSITYMKNDYAVNSYNAFQARSTGDIGGEFCKMFVSSRYPNNKNFFDNLLQPDSPVQFSAWFDEIPYTGVTMPATSQYKVFYFIYAGKDEGVSYQVYLKNPPESAYVYSQQVVVVATGFVPKGEQASETRDLTAPAGYKELCVRINGQDNCGFGKVSTSFALNYISDQYYKDQLTKDIKTEEECISGVSSLFGVTQTANIQEGVASSINPELEKQGVVRVCSTTNPGTNSQDANWKEVGYCDNQNVKCWLEVQSVKNVIKNTDIANEIIQSGKVSESIESYGFMPVADSESKIGAARTAIESLKKKIVDEADNNKRKILLESISTSIERGTKVLDTYDLKLIIDNLESVKSYGATNQIKAQALVEEFSLYVVITEGWVRYDGEVEAAAKKAFLIPTSTSSVTPVVGFSACIDVCKEASQCTAKNCHKVEKEKCYFVVSGSQCRECPDTPSISINKQAACQLYKDKTECEADNCDFTAGGSEHCEWGQNNCVYKFEETKT